MQTHDYVNAVKLFKYVYLLLAHNLTTICSTWQPCKTLRKFYYAFRDADPTHALVQCVDIMSDDQSMLLKRFGGDDSNDNFAQATCQKFLKSTKFQYQPKKVQKSQLTPWLPQFLAHTEMRFMS